MREGNWKEIQENKKWEKILQTKWRENDQRKIQNHID